MFAGMDHEPPQFEDHRHEALLHSHPHFHVTHNYNHLTGGFDHLYSQHAHEHDHAALAHSHVPHQDFDREHEGEAHVHDHAAPARTDVAKEAAGVKKAPPKKAAGAKKAAAKKAAPAAIRDVPACATPIATRRPPPISFHETKLGSPGPTFVSCNESGGRCQSSSADLSTFARCDGSVHSSGGRWCSRAHVTVSGSLPARASMSAPSSGWRT
jgi:hypothetical protein